jgi:hypothetical protein
MKTIFITINIVFLLLFQSCSKKKDQEISQSDFRLPYLGNFTFQIIQNNWMMGQAPTYDTTYYQGNIRIFDKTDTELDMSSFDNESEIDSKRITIQFKNNLMITPEITIKGEFIEKNGYHYGQSGNFIGNDSIYFYIGGLGGLGGGTNFTVRGHRI